MKKLISAMVVLFLLANVSLAQGVSGGIKAGLNLSNMDISGNGFSLDTKTLAGFHGGLYLTAMFNEHVGIQPEILYSAQGCKTNVFNTTGRITANYFILPVLLRYNINEMFSLHAGPQIGILASAEGKSGNNSTDLKDDASSTDFNLAFGGTIDLPMKLNFTARYCLGLSDVDKDDTSTTKNNTFQISVGYKLF